MWKRLTPLGTEHNDVCSLFQRPRAEPGKVNYCLIELGRGLIRIQSVLASSIENIKTSRGYPYVDPEIAEIPNFLNPQIQSRVQTHSRGLLGQMAAHCARGFSPSAFFPRSLRTKFDTLLFRPVYMYPSFASSLSQSRIPPASPGLNTFRAAYHTPTVRTPTMANSPSYYMRELPKENLIGYDTVEGKRLFKQALLEGGLEAFFPLSQQFLTASSPKYFYASNLN